MLKNNLKKIARAVGFEVNSYNLNTSRTALMSHLFDYHKINLIFDVGANRGQYASFLRECNYTGAIVSFEPLSSTYSELLLESQKDPLWQIAPRAAIGDREGEITINIAANSLSSSVLPMLDTHLKADPDSAYSGSETVSLHRLDTIATKYIDSENPVIFLKADVQGFEKSVIEGATRILPLIKGIQLELSLVPLYGGQPLFDEMIDFLKGLGYELYSLLPGFTDFETGRMLQVDGVFFRL